jgi:hypothetical protein
MSRGKAISVKIATTKVIKALESALAKLEKDYSAQDALEAKHQKSLEAYHKQLIDLSLANVKKAENFRTNYRSWNNTLNIDFDVKILEKDAPKEPRRDYDVIHFGTYTEQKAELENAIRILKMTDEEVVNTSTYNAVARYL